MNDAETRPLVSKAELDGLGLAVGHGTGSGHVDEQPTNTLEPVLAPEDEPGALEDACKAGPSSEGVASSLPESRLRYPDDQPTGDLRAPIERIVAPGSGPSGFARDVPASSSSASPMGSEESFPAAGTDLVNGPDPQDVQATSELPAVNSWPAAEFAKPEDTALYLGAFFRELLRCGVKDFVISPGARSTALAMVAFELAGEVYVDVDERGAAYFALGMAKATGNPVAVICTSGTAVANWYPAVLEAEASRVPLLLLSSDRPPRLQNIAAHQTTNQLHLFGSHVGSFYQMPLPGTSCEELAYARQVALDACIAAHGVMPGAASCDAGPVHVNFPFDEPLTPAAVSSVASRIDELPAFRVEVGLPPSVVPGQVLLPKDAQGLCRVFAGKRTVALCGEGSCNSEADLKTLVEFARKTSIPLFADPLSGLRIGTDELIIDNYDTVLGEEDALLPEVIIRFGRWPVSKRCTTILGSCGAVQLVVDMRNTRDATASTSMLVRTSPVAFAQAMCDLAQVPCADVQFARDWVLRNEVAGRRIAQVASLPNMDSFEGAYIDRLLDLAPDGSLVFAGNSMSIRAIDTFWTKDAKRLRMLCNRGLSGIDGTLSAAFGAAQSYDQTTVVLGDLSFLHDVNALALQHEMILRQERGAQKRTSIVVVVLNNGGGAIFDMLPQKSEQDYFERLFLTPQKFDLKALAQAFEVEYCRAETLPDFGRVYRMSLGRPGITILEVPLPLAGVRERYERFW